MSTGRTQKTGSFFEDLEDEYLRNEEESQSELWRVFLAHQQTELPSVAGSFFEDLKDEYQRNELLNSKRKESKKVRFAVPLEQVRFIPPRQ